ncbi:FtsJ-like methyltransferase [Microdochium nivale]|nr:FtsJ-like methyltransferase [Microdochium nivale]
MEQAISNQPLDQSDTTLQDPGVVEDHIRQPTADQVVFRYLHEKAPLFAKLHALKMEGHNSSAATSFFKRQRLEADTSNDGTSEKTALVFFDMMKRVGRELRDSTGAFAIKEPKKKSWDEREKNGIVLDFCLAPGGFVVAAVEGRNWLHTVGFTLPCDQGGHKIMLPKWLKKQADIRELDITMLAEDMGFIATIPPDHPDVFRFLPRQLDPSLLVDLAICDGQVLRNQEREPYREPVEAIRLTSVQLALGLSHLRPGGNMLVLLHRIDSWKSIALLHTFSKFADVQVYKPQASHRKRSSFYLVAKNVRSDSADARQAVEKWKSYWRAATFGAAEDLQGLRGATPDEVEAVLEEFGEELIRLAYPVWQLQANALSDAPWMKKKKKKDKAAEEKKGAEKELALTA